MGAVMISVDPVWAEMIADGRKKVWVAKNIAKTELPFTVYMYCNTSGVKCVQIGEHVYGERFSADPYIGSVIGEFECYGYDTFRPAESGVKQSRVDSLNETRMSAESMVRYMNGETAYGWRIRKVIVYDPVLPVSDFGIRNPPKTRCYVGEK